MVDYTTSAVPALFISINTALVFMVAAVSIQGTLTVGALIAFSAYMARATGPVQTLLGLYIMAAGAGQSAAGAGDYPLATSGPVAGQSPQSAADCLRSTAFRTCRLPL
ncbi:MAG: hypothetical protein R3F53_25225 [Gammaproteobacteria bacterium]